MIKAIAELRDRTTIGHTSYSPSSISDFKKTLKKFVKYASDGGLPKFWSDIQAVKNNPNNPTSYHAITFICSLIYMKK